ncbi:RHS repeat protein [Marinobacter sp. R17]|uniref:DUF6531 domain-containing protein n=1 Tax=Marinobacter sp. R17 TaxID=2484250 RepID=UPI000F4CFA08|nr:DUF6531 domain-containing protein [Marinobacter sp. R17]ROT94720.1 RHS repeat protein [Marinobacter sp. R17]
MSFHARMVSCLIVGAALTCSAQATIRDYYEEPGLNPFKDTINQNFGEHIDPFSGHLQLTYTDLVIPGNGGFDLQINRVYNNPQDATLSYSPYGYGWDMHFGRVVIPETYSDRACNQNLYSVSVIDNPSLELPDGSRQLLVLADQHSPELITKQWWSASCNANNDFIVKSPDGTTYTMDYRDTDSDEVIWYATNIEDANGNSMTINYQTNTVGVTYIDSISTSDGRSVSYSYSNVNTDAIHLASITANGETWTYNYTYTAGTSPAYPQLTSVTRPDGLSWDYTYYPLLTNGDAGSLAVDTVTYPTGGTIDYDYGYTYFDSGAQKATTVLVGKTNGGRDITPATWSYTYTPSYSSGSGYDETMVVAPDHQEKYYHFGYQNAVPRWEVGLKAAKETYDLSGTLLEQKVYSYSSLLLSNENFWHGRDTTQIDTTTVVPLLTNITDWRQSTSVETQYSDFDAYGFPATTVETANTTEGVDRTTTKTYSHDASNWILGLVTQDVIDYPNGAPVTEWTINRTYDSAGNMLTEDNSGVLTTYTYTTEGDVATVTDANNNVTTYSGYYRGAAQTINHPEGVSESRVINANGTLASSTNGRGYTTDFSWDGLHRLIGIDFPIHASVSVVYDDESAVLTRGDFQETRSFDGFGRDIGMKHEDTATGDISETTVTRNSVGLASFKSYPNSSQGDTIAYDALRRVVSVTHADQTSKTISYPSGFQVNVVDENGNETDRIFNSQGTMDRAWLSTINSPESISTNIRRNGLGQVYEVFQGELQSDNTVQGFRRSYTHDARGFLVQETHSESGTTVYGRDNVGNMTSKEVGTSGIVETRTYDDLDRLKTVSYSDGTPTATYTYDNNGNLKLVSSSVASRSYTYDANDNLTDEALSVGSVSYDVVYDIDTLDQVSGLTYPSGRVIDYGTNALGWQTQATPYVTDVDHFGNGLVASMTYANGVVTTQTLDSLERPDTLVVNNGQTDFVDLDLGYDSASNVTSIVDNASSLHGVTVGYDGVDRMTSATGLWGTETITYDARGNIKTRDRDGTTQEYYYSGQKLTYRVFPSFYYTITHDTRGNMTSDGSNVMVYNGANRLASIDNGSDVIDYGYDGAGTRVSRTSPTESMHVLYDSMGDLLGEYDQSAGFKEYIYVDSQVAAKVSDDTTVVGQ